MNALTAVTAQDPYPYYERLVSEQPFFWDEYLQMWIGASASAVEEILTNPTMRVRPPSEPVPRAIIGTPLGDVFGRFARMTDGPSHDKTKSAVAGSLNSLDARALSAASERCADRLARSVSAAEANSLSSYLYALPVHVIASVLGLSEDSLRSAAASTRDVVRSLGASSTQDDVARGVEGVRSLDAAFESLLEAPDENGSLFSVLASEGRRTGIDSDAVIANAIGFLFQSYDATAALMGNVLMALARENVGGADLRDVVAEVARHDSPVQNTRRYAACETAVDGSAVRAGDAVLAVLAAANRDAAVNPDPRVFDAGRRERRTYTFGLAAHACPGSQIACTIAQAGIAALLNRGLDPGAPIVDGYVPSPNVRMPNFKGLTFLKNNHTVI